MIKSVLSLVAGLLLPLAFTNCLNAQQPSHKVTANAPKIDSAEVSWVDSLYNHLTLQERIGQLFMVAAYSGGKNYNETEINKLIANHQIGGIIFMQGTPEKQVQLTNQYQKNAQLPLLIGMDAEWGVGMRLTGVKNYPYQILLGATRDTNLVTLMGKSVAEQCKRLGVHIDFAPDVDVNNNSKNPVINFRSFGSDKRWVSRLGIAYMKGLQDNGIMACAKHFPGHGDVSVDSHKDLPVINKPLSEIQDVELYPFRQLINAGVQSVMIAHLSVPALEDAPHLPTTLSHKVVTDLLRNQMGFQGLIFTDALNMQGVTKYFPSGEVELKAFLAGNDVLLFAQSVPVAINKIKEAVESGQVAESDLAIRVKKILTAKYRAGLADFKPIKEDNVTADLNAGLDRFWEMAAQRSVTWSHPESISEGNQKLGYLKISVGNSPSQFYNLLKNEFSSIKALTSSNSVSQYDKVIVGIHGVNLYPGTSGNYGLSATQIAMIKKLAKNKNVIFVVFGNAYLLDNLCDASSVITAYQDNSYTQTAVINVLSGKKKAIGVLPVEVCQ